MNRYEDELARRLSQEQSLVNKEVELAKERERLEFARQSTYNKRKRIAEVNYSHLAVSVCNLAREYDLPNYPLVALTYRGRGKLGRADQVGRIIIAGEIGLVNNKIYENPRVTDINSDGTIYYNSSRWYYYSSKWRSKDTKVAIRPYHHIGEYLSVDDEGRAILEKSSGYNRDTGATTSWTVDVEEFVMSNITKAIANLNRPGSK